jgi:tyrosyl-tRNA synthetase
MSKSKGNYIGITDSPGGANGMFGKVMKLPDNVMEQYYTLVTDLPESEFKAIIAANPRDAKVKLAKYIITWLHDAAAADQAEKDFFTATRDGGVPDVIPELSVEKGNHKLAPLMVKAGFVASNSEAIRKIKENSVKLAGEKVAPDAFNKEFAIDATCVLQMGSKRFVRLVVS